jgi:1-acyl-sn-glycerol-3-phosphate acyltransferase
MTAVLRRGDLLVVAGEGRLSDEENRILPLETGVAHFAIQAGVPVLPTAVIGTRWVAFGRTVRFRVGHAVYAPARGATRGRASRALAASLTEQIQAELERLLSDVEPSQPPGRVGRLISDAFNDRPWLTDPEWNKHGR